MAELIAEVKIDGFECVEDIAQVVLSWTYKGKTIKEWADSITEPKTNADRIRSMTDEELVEFLLEESECPCYGHKLCTGEDDLPCEKILLKWLKQEATK